MRSDAEKRAINAAKMRRWRALNPEKAKKLKRKYYASETGRLQKRKEDAAYIASGKRAETEKRRAQKPLSDARRACRSRWAAANRAYYTADRARRRALDKQLSVDDFWVLQEAVLLARLRERVVGGKWHVDHIFPVSKGGQSTPDNLQVVPARWNISKSNAHTERFFGAGKE